MRDEYRIERKHGRPTHRNTGPVVLPTTRDDHASVLQLADARKGGPLASDARVAVHVPGTLYARRVAVDEGVGLAGQPADHGDEVVRVLRLNMAREQRHQRYCGHSCW